MRPRMDVYRAESTFIMEILRSFTPVIEKVSVDEAKCEVYAKRLEEKEHQRRASVVTAKSAVTPNPLQK